MPFDLSMSSSTAEATATLHIPCMREFLSAMQKLVPKKSTMGVLKYIRIRTSNTVCTLTCNVLDCMAELSLNNPSGVGEIDVAVDFTAFMRVVTQAPKGRLSIERTGNALSFNVNGIPCGTLQGIAGTDCPPDVLLHPGTLRFERTFTDYDITFTNKYIAPYCTDDPELTVIRGIIVSWDGTNTGVAATNRHVLVGTRLLPDAKSACSIPPVSFKMAGAFGEPVTLHAFENGYTLSCKSCGTTFIIRGKFVDGSIPPTLNRMANIIVEHEYPVDVGSLRRELNNLLSDIVVSPEGNYAVVLVYGLDTLSVTDVPKNYEFSKGTCIKVDALKLSKVLDRFQDTSVVTFRSGGILERPTIWEDCNGISLLMPLR